MPVRLRLAWPKCAPGLGEPAGLTMSTYGHVIEELEDARRLEAEAAIKQARRELIYPIGTQARRELGVEGERERRKPPLLHENRPEPETGIEPVTCCLQGSCSAS